MQVLQTYPLRLYHRFSSADANVATAPAGAMDRGFESNARWRQNPTSQRALQFEPVNAEGHMHGHFDVAHLPPQQQEPDAHDYAGYQDARAPRHGSNPSSPARQRHTQEYPAHGGTIMVQRAAVAPHARGGSLKRTGGSKENLQGASNVMRPPPTSLYPAGAVKSRPSREIGGRAGEGDDSMSFKQQIRALQEDLARRVEEEVRIQQARTPATRSTAAAGSRCRCTHIAGRRKRLVRRLTLACEASLERGSQCNSLGMLCVPSR